MSWFRKFAENKKVLRNFPSLHLPYSGVIENKLNKTQRFHQSMHWISFFKQTNKKMKKTEKNSLGMGNGKKETWRNSWCSGADMQSCLMISPCLTLDLVKWRNLHRLASHFHLRSSSCLAFIVFVLICMVSGSKMFGVWLESFWPEICW